MDGGMEAPVIHDGTTVNGPTVDGPTEEEQMDDGQNNDGPKDVMSPGEQSGSARSFWHPSTWFSGGKKSGGAPKNMSGEDRGTSAVTGGGDNPRQQASVAANVERGLAPLGKWRNNAEKLFKGWGEHTKTKAQEAFEYARQRDVLSRVSGDGLERQDHSLEVTSIRTRPDEEALKYTNAQAESKIYFGVKHGSPRRSAGEWFNDTFGRGTTRKKVQALEIKADELEQQLGKGEDRNETNETLKEMSVVLDKLEESQRNLHRKWWQFSRSETELQKSQRGTGSQDSAKSQYSLALDKKVKALREILLTSSNLSEGLLDDSTDEELQKAKEIAAGEGDKQREKDLQQAKEDRAQAELEQRKTTDLLQNVDNMLRNGAYKYPERQSKLERYRQELERRYTEQEKIDSMHLVDRPLKDAMWFTDKEQWKKRRGVFDSQEYQEGTLNLDYFDNPVEEEPVSLRPKNVEGDGPVYGPEREPQANIDARVQEARQAKAESQVAEVGKFDQRFKKIEAGDYGDGETKGRLLGRLGGDLGRFLTSNPDLTEIQITDIKKLQTQVTIEGFQGDFDLLENDKIEEGKEVAFIESLMRRINTVDADQSLSEEDKARLQKVYTDARTYAYDFNINLTDKPSFRPDPNRQFELEEEPPSQEISSYMKNLYGDGTSEGLKNWQENSPRVQKVIEAKKEKARQRVADYAEEKAQAERDRVAAEQ